MIRQLFLAFAVGSLLAGPGWAQTTTGTSTGTTTGTGATGASGGNTVSSSGGGGSSSSGGSGASGSSAAGPFQGAVSSGFSGNYGTTTTNSTSSGGGVAGGSATAIPSTNNPWKTTYGNPYAIGQTLLGGSSGGKTGAAAKGFGQPLFTSATTGISAVGAAIQNNSKSGNGFNNSGLSKSPRYTAALSEDIPLPVHPPAQLQSKVQDILARSSQIANGNRIQVVVNGDRVFLVGNVGSERERRIAESVIRLTPGVGDVENRLAIAGRP